MFCPACGRDVEDAGLCAECYLDRHPFDLKKKEIEICDCDRLFAAGSWSEEWEPFLTTFVTKNLVLPDDVILHSVDVTGKREKDAIALDVDVIVSYRGVQAARNLQFRLAIGERACPTCSRLSGGYFEAVLQYRGGGDPPILPEPTFIANIEAVTGGVDYYLASQDYGDQLAQRYYDKGFLVKRTAKIYGKRDGQDMYRIYYSVKRPEFSKGDIIEFKSNPYVVESVGKIVNLRGLVVGGDKQVPLQRLLGVPVLAHAHDAFRAVVTEVTPEETVVMGLSKYRNLRLANPRKGLATGDEVDVIRIDEKTYLL